MRSAVIVSLLLSCMASAAHADETWTTWGITSEFERAANLDSIVRQGNVVRAWTRTINRDRRSPAYGHSYLALKTATCDDFRSAYVQYTHYDPAGNVIEDYEFPPPFKWSFAAPGTDGRIEIQFLCEPPPQGRWSRWTTFADIEVFARRPKRSGGKVTRWVLVSYPNPIPSTNTDEPSFQSFANRVTFDCAEQLAITDYGVFYSDALATRMISISRRRIDLSNDAIYSELLASTCAAKNR
jgi:hypothetical protein